MKSLALLLLPLGALLQFVAATDENVSSIQSSIPSPGLENLAFYNMVNSGDYRKIGQMLGQVVTASETESSSTDELAETFPDLMFTTIKGPDQQSEVTVEVIFRLGSEPDIDTMDSMASEFEDLGFRFQLCTKNVCSGFALVDSLVALSNYPEVQFIKPAIRPIVNGSQRRLGFSPRTGSVTSEGDIAMNSDIARITYGVDGTGQVSKDGILFWA